MQVCGFTFISHEPTLWVCTGREHHEMDILLFHELLDHVSRVDRVLTSPGGSLLLSGRSGVGRSSAVSLVAHMHQIDIVTPHISRSYSLKHFKNDLKNVSYSVIRVYMYVFFKGIIKVTKSLQS